MAERTPLRAGLVFGFGLGGMVDGILLHQILQWHHLVSEERSTATVEGWEHNTLADGIFHAATLGVLLVGAVLLFRTALRPAPDWGRWAIAGVLVGYGAFNVVDEVVFHLLLRLHHIRMVEDYLVYDLGYTILGLVIAGIGLAIRPRADRTDRAPAPTPAAI